MDFRAKGISNRSYATLNEQIGRENELRIKWNLRYDNKLTSDSVMDFNSTSKSLSIDRQDGSINWRTKLNELEKERYMQRNRFKIPEIKLIPKKSDYKEEVNEYLTKLGVKDENSNSLRTFTMYEQDPLEKSYLYSGISRDKEGRYKYLSERKKYKPDQKYVFPTTSSMQIGWRLYDDNLKLSPRLHTQRDLAQVPSQYGIKNVVINEFHRNNGELSDNWKDDYIKVQNRY